MSHNKKVTDADIVRAVENADFPTRAELAETLDLDPGNMGRRLKDATDAGILTRDKRGGRSHKYAVPDTVGVDGDRVVRKATGAEAANDDPNAQDVTFDRDYEWNDHIPLSPPEYISTNGEREELVAYIAGRHRLDGPAVGALGGPTASGKTLLVENIAAYGDGLGGTPAPMFTVQCHPELRAHDIIGSPTIRDGNAIFQDGPLTKALLCSRDRPVVLLVDEYKRARPQALEAMFSALDHRCRVELPGIAGSVTVQGDADNLVVIGTKNEGDGYNTAGPEDLATERRFAEQHYIDYLGVNHPDKEAQLVSDRTGISAVVATKMVDAANELRAAAKERENTLIKHGLPTGALISWANKALMNEEGGLSDPLARAAESAVISVLYTDVDREQVSIEANSIIEGHVYGMSVTTVDDESDAMVVCMGCNWSATRAEAEADDGVDLVEMLCPVCNDLLDEE